MDIIIPIIVTFLILFGIGFILLIIWTICMAAGAADRALEKKELEDIVKELEEKKNS